MIAKSRKQMKLLTTSIGEHVKDYLEKNKTLIVTRVCGVGYFVALTTLAAMCTVVIWMYDASQARIAELENENKNLKSQIKIIEDEHTALTSTYNTMKNSYTTVVSIAKELETENREVVKAYKTQSTELQKFQEREELYNKYEYALFRDEDNTRTDITYDDLKSLEQLAKEKNMGQDSIALILAIAKNESQYYANVKNPESSAIGLCGLTRRTAKYIYENELGSPLGKYNHNTMAYDSELNLEIGISLLDYLSDEYDGNVSKVLIAYRGFNDEAYNNKIDRMLKANINKSLYDLDI